MFDKNKFLLKRLEEIKAQLQNYSSDNEVWENEKLLEWAFNYSIQLTQAISEERKENLKIEIYRLQDEKK